MFDLHNHMLPGLDDGSPDWENTLAMARIAVEDGIEGVMCTPHWIVGLYNNTRSVILDATQKLQARLMAEDIPLEIYPGSELRLDIDLLSRIESKEILTLNDSGRYALIELPEDVLPQHMTEFFRDLQFAGITPIIAHPERNRILMKHPVRLFRWVDNGVLTQVTASSVLGRFGEEIRLFSLSLLKHNLVHVLATDSHGPEVRTPKLTKGLKAVEKLVGERQAFEMVFEAPRRIIRGESVSTYDPIPFESRFSHSSFLKRFFSFIGLSSR